MIAPLFRLAVVLCLLGPAARLGAQNYEFTTFAGSTDWSQRGVDGRGTAARFYGTALALDARGDLILSDTANHTIRRVARSGEVTTVAGANGVVGTADGAGTNARFNLPRGVAVDAANNIYVADTGNHRIRKITPDGVVSTLAGSGQGNADGTGAAALFYVPTGIALDLAGNVLVADAGNRALRSITPQGRVTTLAQLRPAGGVSSAYEYVAEVAVDPAGNIYVAEAGTRLRRFTVAGGLSAFVGGDLAGSNDGVGSEARFQGLISMAVAADGMLFVTDSDNHTVRQITPAGLVRTLAGKVGEAGSRDGVNHNALFYSPQAVAVDHDGTLYILDAQGRTIRKGTPRAGPPPPVITQEPAPPELRARHLGAGASFSLTSTAAGTGPLTLQWTKNGAALAGATTNTLTIPALSAADEGRYVFTATNAGGTSVSEPVDVRVYTPTLTQFTSRRANTAGSFLWGIAAGAQLVAVGTRGTILSSTNGRDWIARNSGTSAWLVGVTYGAGRFIAVGDQGVILVSSDGNTWRPARSSGTTQRLNNVTWAAGIFVAVGEAGTIVTSTDGETWTARASGASGWLRGIIYKPFAPLPPPLGSGPLNASLGSNGSAMFYAGGQNGVLLRSADGIAWAPATTGAGNAAVALAKDIEALAEGPIGIGQDGLVLTQTSWSNVTGSNSKTPGPDGRPISTTMIYTFVNWPTANIGFNARFRGLARGAGAVFATGENGVIAAAATYAGPWALVPSGTQANLVSGAFFGNSLYVVGENETILQSEALYTSRLINLSTRGTVGAGANAIVSGFVVQGETPKQVLVRAIGPTLANFGVTNTLPNPVLTLFNATGATLATNTRWSTASDPGAIADAAARVGAFPLPSGSADSALLLTLPPGAYTAQVADRNSVRGASLVEIYDADPRASDSSTRAVNISTRGRVGGTDEPLIAGFVLHGAAARRVLVRAIGPALAEFGLTDVLPEPQLRLYDGSGGLMQTATAWSTRSDAGDIRGATQLAGAFALDDASPDAAMIVTLLPGRYTVQVSGVNNTSGVALVEVYDLP